MHDGGLLTIMESLQEKKKLHRPKKISILFSSQFVLSQTAKFSKTDGHFRKIYSTNFTSVLPPFPKPMLPLFPPHFKRNSTTLSWGGGMFQVR
jgi:hypothetical protein